MMIYSIVSFVNKNVIQLMVTIYAKFEKTYQETTHSYKLGSAVKCLDVNNQMLILNN